MNMPDAEIDTLKPGDRIFRWVWTGASNGYDTADMVEAQVVRVNRLSVTVINGFGGHVRWPRQDVGGRADW